MPQHRVTHYPYPHHPDDDPWNPDRTTLQMAVLFIEQQQARGNCFHLALSMGSDVPIDQIDHEQLQFLGPAIARVLVLQPRLLEHAMQRLDAEQNPAKKTRYPVYYLGGVAWCPECAANQAGHSFLTTFYSRLEIDVAGVRLCSQCRGSVIPYD